MALAIFVTLATANAAQATAVRDLVRTKGSEGNTLVGVGLVFGLNGTGDGQFSSTMRMVARHLQTYADENVLPEDLADASNIALVHVECQVPETGARDGNQLDVRVVAAAASSLEGGYLIYMPLGSQHAQDAPPLAFASGPLRLDDEGRPNHAIVQQGARMVGDIRTQLMDEFGRITLVIDDAHASYPIARLIADQINGVFAAEIPPIAEAVDQSNVVITVPAWERENPVRFIAPILDLTLPEDQLVGDARVYVDPATGVILISGNVSVAPHVFTHRDLTVRVVDPMPAPDPFNPTIRDTAFGSVDPSGFGGADLAELLEAFNTLGLDSRTRVDLVLAMHEMGMFHARLEVAD